MTIRYKFAGLTRSLTIGLLLVSAPTLTLAQDAEPTWVNFRIHTVDRDQGAAWESLMKERRDAEERQRVDRSCACSNAYVVLKVHTS